MTVGELVGELNRYPGDAKVMATYEGLLRVPVVYQTEDGTVIIDADGNRYYEGVRLNDGLPTEGQ